MSAGGGTVVVHGRVVGDRGARGGSGVQQCQGRESQRGGGCAGREEQRRGRQQAVRRKEGVLVPAEPGEEHCDGRLQGTGGTVRNAMRKCWGRDDGVTCCFCQLFSG